MLPAFQIFLGNFSYFKISVEVIIFWPIFEITVNDLFEQGYQRPSIQTDQLVCVWLLESPVHVALQLLQNFKTVFLVTKFPSSVTVARRILYPLHSSRDECSGYGMSHLGYPGCKISSLPSF